MAVKKPDGTLTTDINESHMLYYLITKDEDDLHYHKTIRTLTERPIQTANDREYMPKEIWNAIDAIKCKKSTRRRWDHQ